MRKSEPDPSRDGYLAWSRDPAVGLFAVLPLWLCYEGLRLQLTPDERNGAEVLISEIVRLFGPTAFLWLRLLFAATVVAAAVTLSKRQIPWLRVSMVVALEGTVYALVLGPLAAALAASSDRILCAGQAPEGGTYDLLQNVVGSLGAGIFEELVFRLVLMSVLALALGRAAVSFGLPKVTGVVLAIVLSALVFSLFHHLGPGAPPFSRPQFVFRFFAGVVLGVLFAVRGFGVCVYTHAMYDVFYYLSPS